MLGEGACWPRTRLLETEPVQHPTGVLFYIHKLPAKHCPLKPL
jgi:hypothetical protein